jgi:hypothetical protein
MKIAQDLCIMSGGWGGDSVKLCIYSAGKQKGYQNQNGIRIKKGGINKSLKYRSLFCIPRLELTAKVTRVFLVSGIIKSKHWL